MIPDWLLSVSMALLGWFAVKGVVAYCRGLV